MLVTMFRNDWKVLRSFLQSLPCFTNWKLKIYFSVPKDNIFLSFKASCIMSVHRAPSYHLWASHLLKSHKNLFSHNVSWRFTYAMFNFEHLSSFLMLFEDQTRFNQSVLETEDLPATTLCCSFNTFQQHKCLHPNRFLA